MRKLDLSDIAIFVLGIVLLVSSGTVIVEARTPQIRDSILPNLAQDAARHEPAFRRELLDAAKAHGVSINAEQIGFGGTPVMTVSHAPLVGIEKYRAGDFAKGAPIMLVIFRSSSKSDVPDGSYVVRVTFRPGARSGTALFIDPSGRSVARRRLGVYTRAQAALLFPEVYDNPEPQFIPNITSTHVWHNNKWSVDCAGWEPYRVLFY